MHASVRKALRQAWELDDADKAERLIKNLARRLEHDAPGVSASILEGLDEILTVTRRMGLPVELRRSLAWTNIIENMRDHPAGLPQRQTLAGRQDGAPLDRRRHAGGRQGSGGQGPQATTDPAGSPGGPQASHFINSDLERRPRLRSLLNQQCLLMNFNSRRDIPFC